MKKILEVCVDSLASAKAAIAGGADRLELCSALAVGGLSPYGELLEQIKATCPLPVRCLMRPRPGDFLYTEDEIELMCAQIRHLRAAGADGFVLGALTPEGALDSRAMEQLLNACGDKPVTLHRCIDVAADPARVYRTAAGAGTGHGAHQRRGGVPVREGKATLASLLALREELNGPGGADRRRGECRGHPGTTGGAAGGAGLPHERQNAAGKRHALPQGGRAHGPARAGRMAYPGDRRRGGACCQSGAGVKRRWKG